MAKDTKYTLQLRGLQPAEYLVLLANSGIRVSERALSMFANAPKESTKGTVVVATYSVGELGLRTNTRLPRIYDKALKLGLKLCPWELAAELLLLHPDLEVTSFLRIAMTPIEISPAGKCIFTIGVTTGRPMLIYNFAQADLHWKLDQRFLFVTSE